MTAKKLSAQMEDVLMAAARSALCGLSVGGSASRDRSRRALTRRGLLGNGPTSEGWILAEQLLRQRAEGDDVAKADAIDYRRTMEARS